MTDEKMDRLVECERDEYEEYFRECRIAEGCCECDDIPEYEFRGEYFCEECLDDFLNQIFAENYTINEKADMLSFEVEEL